MSDAIRFLIAPIYIFALVDFLRTIGNPRLVFLNGVASAFIIANCLALVFSPKSMDEFNYSIESEWLSKASLAYLPFVITCWLSAKVISQHSSRIKCNKNSTKTTKIPPIILITTIALGGLLCASYIYVDGWKRLLAITEVFDRQSAYSARYSFDDETNSIAALSQIASIGVIPIAFAYLIETSPNKKRSIYTYICLFPIVLGFTRNSCNLQRSNIIVGGTMYIVLTTLSFYNFTRLSNQATKRFLVLTAFIFSLTFITLVAVVYSFTDKDRGAVSSGLQRTITIPSHTAAVYFGIFDGSLPKRGITKMHAMSSDRSSSGDISYWQIGEIASTDPHCANANFLAIAFSAAGWIGTLAIGITIAILSAVLSNYIGTYGLQFATKMLVANSYGIFVLVQSDLNAAISVGLFCFSGILVGFDLISAKTQNPKIKQPL